MKCGDNKQCFNLIKNTFRKARFKNIFTMHVKILN